MRITPELVGIAGIGVIVLGSLWKLVRDNDKNISKIYKRIEVVDQKKVSINLCAEKRKDIYEQTREDRELLIRVDERTASLVSGQESMSKELRNINNH